MKSKLITTILLLISLTLLPASLLYAQEENKPSSDRIDSLKNPVTENTPDIVKEKPEEKNPAEAKPSGNVIPPATEKKEPEVIIEKPAVEQPEKIKKAELKENEVKEESAEKSADEQAVKEAGSQAIIIEDKREAEKPEIAVSDIKTKSHRYSYALTFGFVQAAGDFYKVANYGFSANANVNIYNIIYKNTVLKFSAGANLFGKSSETIKSIAMFPLSVSAGYSLSLFKNFELIPFAGAGLMFSRMNYSPEGADSYGNYTYKTGYYTDPLLVTGCELSYTIWKSVSVVAVPMYRIFFEKGNVGQTPGVSFGVRMLF